MVGTARRAMIAIASLCAIGLCLIIAWYTSRPIPVEDEQMILSRALNLPPERLRYGGADSIRANARIWRIVSATDETAVTGTVYAGTVFAVHSKVKRYVAQLAEKDLMSAPVFSAAFAPLSEADAIRAAKRIAARLWAMEPRDVTKQDAQTRARQPSPTKANESRLIVVVDLAFRRRGSDSPRSAEICFYKETGVCYQITAQFGAEPATN